MSQDQSSKGGVSQWLWIPALVALLFACWFCSNIRVIVRLATAQADQPPCESGVWVQQEDGSPICQPSNAGEPNVVTLYATYRFGATEEYATPMHAAQTAQAKLGNRPVKVYCDQQIWDTNLDSLIAELGKNTIFGVPENSFCLQGGYIEIWPAQ